MFVKMPELRMQHFKSYASDVSDGISAANHYVGGHHAFTMWQVEPDVSGLTNYKVIVSECYYQQFMQFFGLRVRLLFTDTSAVHRSPINYQRTR